MLYDELISVYKKEYNQAFKSVDNGWRQKHDHKNLKGLDYQPDHLQPDQLQPEQLQPDQLVLPKWVKVTKSRLGKIQSIVTDAKNNKLKTSVNKKNIDNCK